MKTSVRVILIILLMFPMIIQARHYVPHDCRVRYSPYAFGPGKSGLVPGDFEYNPYAFSLRSNGLVPGNVQYNPYAFGVGKTGLISEDGCCYPCYPYAGIDDAVGMESAARRFERAVDSLVKTIESHEDAAAYHPGHTDTHNHCRDIAAKDYDARTVARKYLKQRCPQAFTITRILSIDGETVSFDIVLTEYHTIVKYWNPQKIQTVRQNNDFKTKALNRYMCSWANLRKQYAQNGNQIVHIATGDTKDMLDTLICVLETTDS